MAANKLATLAAIIFGVLLVVSYAHTTVTTVEIDESAENPTRRGCSGERMMEQLSHCEQLFMEQCRECGRGGCGGGNARRGSREWTRSMHFDPCCNQLRQIRDSQCRCDGLRQIVRQLQGQYRGEEMYEMMQSARYLPSMCGVGPQMCDFRAVWF